MSTKQTILIECRDCRGTGLYSGLAEGDGCAVICLECEGTGAVEFDYTPFTKRKVKRGIKRVFAESCGYGMTSTDYTDSKGRTVKFSQAGCTYEEWLDGVKPKPVKDLYCPYSWKNRGIGNEPLGKRCVEGGKGGVSISDCKHFEDGKEECWKLYEKKFSDKQRGYKA